jgi:hypothetical protein
MVKVIGKAITERKATSAGMKQMKQKFDRKQAFLSSYTIMIVVIMRERKR